MCQVVFTEVDKTEFKPGMQKSQAYKSCLQRICTGYTV